MTNTQQAQNLQTMIAETARRYVGTKWATEHYDSAKTGCGDVVRQVLAELGITVAGRLRDAGGVVNPLEREPGQLILFYDSNPKLRANDPRHGGILTGQNTYVGLCEITLAERMFEVKRLTKVHMDVIVGRDIGSPVENYAIIRRVT